MVSFAVALRQAREVAGLTEGELARRCRLTAAQVLNLEAGTPADGATINRCALAFGVTPDGLIRGEAQNADIALLFKSARVVSPGEHRGTAAVLELDAILGLSRFSRVAWQLKDLGERLGLPTVELPDLSRKWVTRPRDATAGDYLARAARTELQLNATSPIESMRRLFDERLRVPVVFSGQEEVDPRISGASLLHPAPTVLVTANWLRPWVTRMTLAHELCHLLFHRSGGDATASPLKVSPGEGWVLDREHEEREQEANAFAAAFLVPAFALRQLFQGRRNDTAAAVREVSQRFGVGRKVAVNRLVDTFELGPARRASLLAAGEEWEAAFAEDAILPAEVGLLHGVLRARTLEALRRGLVSRTEARSMLEVPDDAPLAEDDLEPALSAPVLSRERRVGVRLQGQLEARGDARVVGEVREASGGGYQAVLLDLTGREVGRVTTDAEGNPLTFSAE